MTSESFIDEAPLFLPDDDPYILRFRVNPLVWLDRNNTVPIREPYVWEQLSFTRPSRWTGILRQSLNQMQDEDGKFLEEILTAQKLQQKPYPIDDEEFRKFMASPVRRLDRVVSVTVPHDDDATDDNIAEVADDPDPIRESAEIQADIAACGERMGFKIWIPKSDRYRVTSKWHPQAGVLLDALPLNYDEITIRTIEQIDVLWLKGRAIIRAFEVEHTTAIYSGILRMSDLLALQPNMDIKLHIVAPEERQNKVFMEIKRPVFSLLERGPLSEYCTFLTYDNIRDLLSERHLAHLSDSVLDDYAIEAE